MRMARRFIRPGIFQLYFPAIEQKRFSFVYLRSSNSENHLNVNLLLFVKDYFIRSAQTMALMALDEPNSSSKNVRDSIPPTYRPAASID